MQRLLQTSARTKLQICYIHTIAPYTRSPQRDWATPYISWNHVNCWTAA